MPDSSKYRYPLVAAGPLLAAAFLLVSACGHNSGYRRPLPVDQAPLPNRSAPPPALDGGTVVLFDGSSWEGWVTKDGATSPWAVQDDGSVLAGGGDAVTRRRFGDFQLHVEFLCPVMTEKSGQARANSGVYLHGIYEVQVLDSFGMEVAGNGCGALYSIAAPAVNASKPPGEWQTYEILFRAPRFDQAGKVTQFPRVTVLHNGVVIHNNLELPKTTPGGLGGPMAPAGPILLQDHGDPVRYRNIWIRNL